LPAPGLERRRMPGKKGPRFTQSQILGMETIRTQENGDQLKYQNTRSRIWVREDDRGVPQAIVFEVYRQKQWAVVKTEAAE
jgi:hypothetical protein